MEVVIECTEWHHHAAETLGSDSSNWCGKRMVSAAGSHVVQSEGALILKHLDHLCREVALAADEEP